MEFVEKNHILSKGQNGFRARRSCNQHIFTVVETCERIARYEEIGAYLFFLDLKICFDRVCRSKMYKLFRECGISENFIKLLKDMHEKTETSVRTNKNVGKPIKTERGTPQGCCISPASFLLFADHMLRELNLMQLAYPLGWNSVTSMEDTAVLMYCDDLVIICDDADKMQRMIDRCEEIIKSIEMEANVKKCAAMHMDHINNAPTESFTWGGKPIPMPKDYKYMGGWIDKALTFAKHMDCVCKKARAAFARLIPYLRNNDIPIDYRMKAFDALITPLFGYACETWSPFSKTKNRDLINFSPDCCALVLVVCSLIVLKLFTLWRVSMISALHMSTSECCLNI